MAILKTILKQNGNTVLPKAQLNGIDTENILAEKTNFEYSEVNYTAIQDCFIFISGNLNVNDVFVDDVKPYIDLSTSLGNACKVGLFLKKGQTLKISSSIFNAYRVFGIK